MGKSRAKRPPKPRSTAKLFMHGRSQAVRLPKEFRFAGGEVRVSKVGDKVILEPMTKPPFDVEAWLATLARHREVPFPDLPDEPPLAPEGAVAFE